jgi:hypothetical protein
VHSLKWIVNLPTNSWTAITADENMKRSITSERDISLRLQDQVLVGNWMDETFCQSLGKYDTILADYLIGAVDGFSPYTQDIIISKLVFTILSGFPFTITLRLRKCLAPGGRLYIIGMNPIPDTLLPPACIVSEVSSIFANYYSLKLYSPLRIYVR